MNEVTLTIDVPETLQALAIADKVLADRGAVASQSIIRLIWAQILAAIYADHPNYQLEWQI
jgi:hypothetical protein